MTLTATGQVARPLNAQVSFEIRDLKFQISETEIVKTLLLDHQAPGGGEGIRTPDPRVANAVLCQLSYTPLFEISNLRSQISSGTESEI